MSEKRLSNGIFCTFLNHNFLKCILKLYINISTIYVWNEWFGRKTEREDSKGG